MPVERDCPVYNAVLFRHQVIFFTAYNNDDSYIELVARRLKSIMHCTKKQYNTRQEMKCSAMHFNKKTMNQGESYRPIGIL